MNGGLRAWAATLATLTLAVSACGTSSSSSTNIAVGGTLTIDNESGALWQCDFNPYNGSVNGQSFGILYEPLVYDNLLNDRKTPMLASDYKWSSDNKTLTFTIRSGVKWSDGQDFSAADVVYSFNLLKQHPELDLQSDWTVLSDVQPQGTDKVVMTFSQPAVPNFYQIAGQTAIVPQHIWTTYSDPTTQKVDKPVGTGPFTMSACTGQNIQFTRNPNYWQKGLPHLQTVNYPAFLDNDPANAFLAAGQAQWGGQYIPNIDTYYVAKDPQHNHYWFPPIDNINIWFNTTIAPLDNKLVRQAIAYSINRDDVSKKGESGYEPAGNQTGVLSPTFDSWIDKSQSDKYAYKFNPTKAASLLQQAGFTKGGDGIYADSSGKKLSFSIIDIAGYTDWVASVQVIQDNLKQVGIELKADNLDSQAYFDKLFNGDFQLAYGSLNTSPGPTPYYELRNTLHSGTTAPIGQSAAGDYGRYKNSAVDTLLDQFGATADSGKQHDIIKQVEAVMLEDVPVIPVTEGVAWYQYSTKDFAGWPTKDDPYAAPAPWNLPDWEITLTHLYKTS
ncbi:MAG TPA: ABC transporter substrate-binding protein [Candidatus Dormibacteraeota bacterium]|nr:ABC transporter substrate-binding protein [Candidatus Dormibacteraeota bacterium]